MKALPIISQALTCAEAWNKLGTDVNMSDDELARCFDAIKPITSDDDFMRELLREMPSGYSSF